MSTTISNPTQLYKDSQRSINHICYKWTQTTQFDFDDLRSIANEKFVHAINSFNPNKHTKFNSYLIWIINNAFKNELKSPKNKEMQLDENYDVGVEADIEAKIDFKQRLRQLSKESKMVCDIIFNSPTELKNFTKIKTDKQYNRQLKKHLKTEKGLSDKEIGVLFNEIKSIL